MLYKGYNITRNLHGFYEIYHIDRFLKFDDLKELKAFITEYRKNNK